MGKDQGNFTAKISERLIPVAEGVNILLAGIAALATLRLIHQSLKFSLNSSFIDLAYHYFYSKMIRLSLNPFDPATIEMAENIISIRYAGGQAVYPPSYFFFFQPLTYIPFSILSVMWLCFSLILLVIVAKILIKNVEADRSSIALTFVIAIVGNYQPLYEDLVLGQNNILLLFFAVAAWYGIKNDNDWLSGISIAVMTFIKIQYGFLFLYLIITVKSRVILISAISLLFLEFAGFPQLGLTFFKNYFFAFLHHTAEVSNDISNISFNGQLHKFFGKNHNIAVLMYLSISLTFILLAYFKILRFRRFIPLEILFLIMLTMVPLLSPHTEEHHLVVLLLPIIWIILNIYRANYITKLFFILSILLLVSRYSYARYALNSSILLYPLLCLKSVGALFLFLTLVCYTLKEYDISKTGCKI